MVPEKEYFDAVQRLEMTGNSTVYTTPHYIYYTTLHYTTLQ